MRNFLLTLLLSLLSTLPVAWAADVRALTLRLCTLDHPFPPHTMPDGSGRSQRLLRQAARDLGIVVDNSVAPRLRCLARLRAGEVDAVFSVFLPERLDDGVFPMAGAVADPSRAMSVLRFVLYRQKGGQIAWDGNAFSGLDGRPIGIQTGLAVAQRLRRIGVTVDEGAKTAEQNLEKLVRGRLQAVVAMEGESQPLIDRQFAGRVEMLPRAFEIAPVYLQVRAAYYASHRELVDQLWDGVRRHR